MDINVTEKINYSTNKARLSKTELQMSSVTDADSEIGKEAYRDLALIKPDSIDDPIEIGYSADLYIVMVHLERALERLHKQPGTDLLDINPRNSEDFEPLKTSERLFKKAFLMGLPAFVRVTKNLPTECRFSPAMDVFVQQCCRDFPDIEECIRATDNLRFRHSNDEPQISRINEFYWKLRERLSSPRLRKKIHDYNWQIENNLRNFQSYVDSMFRECARLVVLRLDLEYRAECKPSLMEAVSDLDRFFSNRRHNDIFRARRGYIVKVEFGIYTGYHFHLLLFFDGSIRSNNSDVHHAEEIGEYWKNVITKGKGRFCNVNKDKAKYEKKGRLGIGTIHVSETSLIANLKGIVRYFCKKEQFFKPKSEPKFKTIRKGKAPTLRAKKLGRPRIAKQ